MGFGTPAVVVALDPLMIFSKNVAKNWLGYIWYALSFDGDGNFWFWTKVDSYDYKLYKLTWATGIIELKAEWNNPGDISRVKGMIIKSDGTIYTSVSKKSVTGSSYYFRLASCGTISAPTAPDLDDYIWSSESWGLHYRLYDVFMDQDGEIFGYCREDDSFVKRTGVTTFELALAKSVWNYNSSEVGMRVKLGNNLYIADAWGTLIRYTNIDPSIVNLDFITELPYVFYSVETAICYNPTDGKIYAVFEDSNIIHGYVLSFHYINPQYL